MDEIGAKRALNRQRFSMRMQGPESIPPHKLTLHADLQAQWVAYDFQCSARPVRLLPAAGSNRCLVHATYVVKQSFAKVKRYCACCIWSLCTA